MTLKTIVGSSGRLHLACRHAAPVQPQNGLQTDTGSAAKNPASTNSTAKEGERFTKEKQRKVARSCCVLAQAAPHIVPCLYGRCTMRPRFSLRL